MEEGFVLEDRATQRSTKLVLTKFRLPGMRAKLVGVCVQNVVTEKLIKRSVEVIRAALGDNVDHRTGGAARVRRERVGNDANLLNGIDRWTHANGCDDAFVVIHAVHQLIVQRFRLAVHRNGGTRTTIIRTCAAIDAVRRGLSRTGRHLHESDVVSSVQGQIVHRLLGNIATDG